MGIGWDDVTKPVYVKRRGLSDAAKKRIYERRPTPLVGVWKKGRFNAFTDEWPAACTYCQEWQAKQDDSQFAFVEHDMERCTCLTHPTLHLFKTPQKGYTTDR